MMLRHFPLAVLTLLAATGSSLRAAEHAATPPVQDEDRESLEELLTRLRQKREQLLAALEKRVTPLLDDLRKQVEEKSAKRLAKVRKELSQLGPDIAPILVRSLAPPPEPSRNDLEYSRQISRVLASVPTPAITDSLLALCSSPDPTTKHLALRVLAVSPEPERVSPVVIELFEKSQGETRATALETIAQLGGKENDEILRQVLTGQDEVLRGIAFDAIVTVGAEQFEQEVLALLLDLNRSASFAFKFVAYYSQCPDIMNKEHAGALVAAACDGRVQVNQRIAILEQLPKWERYIDSRMKRSLKGNEATSNRDLERQTLVLLAVLGDNGARRRLLKPYDDDVDKEGLWTGPYINRGTVLYQIGEYSQALRDFKQAIKLSKDEPRSIPTAFEYAARCCAQLGKDKQAAEYLDAAPISLDQLRALASDPVFADLRESRHGKVFRLEE